jgi:SAM-dependent methyltransferase
MREAGFVVTEGDLTDPSSLRELEPFDVVVAGEVIEHLDCPRQLLDFSRSILRPGGKLVITTPNPYAPWRVRSGQLGLVWESVDHVGYLFPSGICELAERAGMLLVSWSTVGLASGRAALADSVRTSLATYRAKRGGRHPTRHPSSSVTDVFQLYLARDRLRAAETSIFVIQTPA